jgi:hypothetical protein
LQKGRAVTVDDLSRGYIPVVIVAGLLVGSTLLGFRVGGTIESFSQKSAVLESRLGNIERDIKALGERIESHERASRSAQGK